MDFLMILCSAIINEGKLISQVTEITVLIGNNSVQTPQGDTSS